MRIKIPNAKWIVPVTAVGLLSVTGCADDKYDINDVDLTIGIGSGELELPGSSTTDIMLSEILDIDDSECVDTVEGGDYMFTQKGADVDPVHPEIDKIVITEESHIDRNVHFDMSSVIGGALNSRRRVVLNTPITAQDDIRMFEYSGERPDGLVELHSALVEENFSLAIKFSQTLSNHVPTLKELSVRFPGYMVLDGVVVYGGAVLKQNGSILELDNVNTGSELVIRGRVKSLDFKSTDTELGKLVFGTETVKLDGRIHVKASFDELEGTVSPSDKDEFYISSEMDLGTFTVTSATGKFDPDIDLSDLGDAEITGVPSFLTDGDVVVDLDNPHILISLDSDLDIGGTITGTLESYKDGGRIAQVKVPEMTIKANDVTKICVCRVNKDIPAGYTAVVVPTLSDLIKTIPDKITFSADAHADKNTVATFKLGHTYTMQPAYRIEAPLAFGADACIIYTDSIEDMNEDLQDFDLSNDARLEITANIENRVPAYLQLSAVAVGVDGNVLGDDEINIDCKDAVVLASGNGSDTETTPVRIIVNQKKTGSLGKLDKIRFTVKATAKMDGNPTVTGVPLNARKHLIRATDVKIKLIGKVTADLN